MDPERKKRLIALASKKMGEAFRQGIQSPEALKRIHHVAAAVRRKLPDVVHIPLDALLGAILEPVPDEDAARHDPAQEDEEVIDLVEGRDYTVHPPDPET